MAALGLGEQSMIVPRAADTWWFWFAIGLLVLVPVHVSDVSKDPWYSLPPKPTGDGPDYENIAFHLAAGRGYKLDNSDPAWRALYESHRGNDFNYATPLNAPIRAMPATGRPPLLPTYVAAVYRVLERGAPAFQWVRLTLAISLAIAGASAVGLVPLLLTSFPHSSRWPNNDLRQRAGTVVGCLVALGFAAGNRTLREYATDFLTEPLALLFTQAFLWAAIALARVPSSKLNLRHIFWAAMLGFILGLMVLARSLFVLWIPGVGVLIALSQDGMRWLDRFRLSLILIMATVLVCLPWWVHNCWALSRGMPLGTQGPITLLGGYSDEGLAAGGDWQFAPEQRLRAELATTEAFQQAASDTERELMVAQAARKEVRRWVAGHVGELPGLFWQRIVTHWNPYSGRSLIWKIAILLGCAVVWFQAGRYRWILLGLPLMNTLLVAALYSTGGRFLVPLYGLLFTLSGIGISGLLNRFLSLRSTSVGPGRRG